MYQVPTLVPLLLLLAIILPSVCGLHLSTSSDLITGRHRQHHWPRSRNPAAAAAAAAVAEEEDDDDYDDGRRSRGSDDEIDSSRLRQALHQLLELNDGELQALMSGISPKRMASRINPSTAFLLTTSRQYLERLNTILSTVEEDSPVKKSTWNPRIARRHKKTHTKGDFGLPADASTETLAEDSDSILGALTELSEYLSGAEDTGPKEHMTQERKRRSHHQGRGRKHQSLETQFERHHYLYYLRSGECPLSRDNIPKMFCPTPSDTGEWSCIEELELCDGRAQCPNQEDEAPTHCLFHNAMRAHIDELTKYILLSKLS